MKRSLAPVIALNPELQRYFWLELQPWRLAVLALPAIVVGLLTVLLDEREAVRGLGLPLLAVLVVLWGSRSAVDAIPREVQEHSWDSQRSVGYGPITMALGKAFGASALSWYCALLLAVLLVLAEVPLWLIGGVMVCGVFAQIVALTLALVFHTAGIGFGRLPRLLAQGLAVAPLTVMAFYWLPQQPWVARALLPLVVPAYAVLLAAASYQLSGEMRRQSPSWIWPLLAVAGAVVAGVAAQRLLEGAVSWVAALAGSSMPILGACIWLLPLAYGAAAMPPRRPRRLSWWRSLGRGGQSFALWPVPPVAWPALLLVLLVTWWELWGVPTILAVSGQIEPIAIVSVLLLVLRDLMLISALRIGVSPTVGMGLGAAACVLLWLVVPAGLMFVEDLLPAAGDLRWPLQPDLNGRNVEASLFLAALQAGAAAVLLALRLLPRIQSAPPLRPPNFAPKPPVA